VGPTFETLYIPSYRTAYDLRKAYVRVAKPAAMNWNKNVVFKSRDIRINNFEQNLSRKIFGSKFISLWLNSVLEYFEFNTAD
jgi:hypothetical protein